MRPVQVRDPVQVVPLQHGCPSAPHWQAVPPPTATQVKLVLAQVVPLQHGCPCAPHWQAVPVLTVTQVKLVVRVGTLNRISASPFE